MGSEVTFIQECTCACGYSESEKGNQFILAVFSKSVVLRTKVLFKKSEVIALQVQFSCQFVLNDVTLHLRSDLHCRASFTTFGLLHCLMSTTTACFFRLFSHSYRPYFDENFH